jgi:metallo-beta-lactamase class B
MTSHFIRLRSIKLLSTQLLSTTLAIITTATLLSAQPPQPPQQSSSTSYPRTDEQRAWNKPFEPFRIIGPIHYVGTADLASYLITSDAGHILLDSGLESNAAQLIASIEKLGFRLRDIKVILNSQSHFDHAAGLAEIKKRSGARLLASAKDTIVLEAGGKNDPAFGNELQFPAVKVDGPIADGQVVTVGPNALTAHLTPGHTPGTTTWTMTVRDSAPGAGGSNSSAGNASAATTGRDYRVVFVGSMTVILEKLDTPTYPEARADFERTFKTLKALQPDIFLAQHAGIFGLADKYARLKAGATPNPFIDPEGYPKVIARYEEAYRKHP